MKNNTEIFISLHILPRQIRATWPTISSLFKFDSKRKHRLRTDGGKSLVSHWSNVANWPLRGPKKISNEQVWNRQEIKLRLKSVSEDCQQSELSGLKILIEIKEALVCDFMLLMVWTSIFFTCKCKLQSFACADSVRIDNRRNARLSRCMMWKKIEEKIRHSFKGPGVKDISKTRIWCKQIKYSRNHYWIMSTTKRMGNTIHPFQQTF